MKAVAEWVSGSNAGVSLASLPSSGKPASRTFRVLVLSGGAGRAASMTGMAVARIPTWQVEFFRPKDGEDCLAEIAGRTGIDIVLLACGPDPSECVARLERLRSADVSLPVLALADSSHPRLGEILIEAGADDFLVGNEIRPSVLKRVAEATVRRRKLECEKAFLASRLELSQRMETVGTLAGGIAHDFNNMLTGIIGFLELAILKSKGRGIERDLIQVRCNCEIMAEMVNLLLAFTSQHGFRDEIVHLNQVLEDLEVLLKHTIAKEISLDIENPGVDATVRGNAAQIHQVFLNLCVNAAHAMPQGGRLSVRVERILADKNYLLTHRSLAEGEYYVVQVSDTGIGMSPETRQRIFEPFFSTKNSEGGKGTGLGLAVTWQILEDHAGHIDVYSELGQGSTFRVFLPVSEEDVVVTERPRVTELPRGDETILLVDDEKVVLGVASELLEQLGYTVLRAEDGQSALQEYRTASRKIDLVILDLSMPRMGGRECLRRLLEMDPQIPVLFSSGHHMESEREALLARGAKGVIQKPYRLDELATKIRTVLDRAPGGMVPESTS